MKLRLAVIVTLTLIISLSSSIRAQEITFEKSDTFFPQFEALGKQDIRWGYLDVPEDWVGESTRTIRIAVSILKNTSNIEDADAVVYIQGGPGASGIQNISSWLYHPLRNKNDIVLFDVRGTGYSEPRLCPDLGREFLDILAKDQPAQKDEKQKVEAVLACKQKLIDKGVNIDTYNSLSVSEDLHALKTTLGYKNWNVYGVSYGTYIAQVYANAYPDDIKTLLLDSSIQDISTYYVDNTLNYMNSLDKVFEACKNEEKCNEQYPNLKKVYYEVISDLLKNPLTVSVDKNIVSSGTFTYNAEDFKIAVQQAMYHKKLIEIVPLLIYQFHERNEDALGNLVAAFSSLLSMDYGVYYCMSCNEALPYNDFQKYQENSSNYDGLNGGISFYRSDFKICDAWNKRRKDTLRTPYDLSSLSTTNFPVLVFSGEFDPITPPTNGAKIARRFDVAYNIKGYTYGHAPGSTRMGREVAENFVNDPNKVPDIDIFKKSEKIEFPSGIILNKGVSKLGNSLAKPDPIFLFPLAIALMIMLIFIFVYTIKLIKNKYSSISNRVIRVGIILTSIIGVLFILDLLRAILEVSKQNYFILAFGLPEDFNYLFIWRFVLQGFLALTLIYYVIAFRRIKDRSIVFSVIFSNILLSVYLFYWGIL